MKENTLRQQLTLLTLFFAVQISAQGIGFISSDWASVKERAKAENKLIFVDVHTTWCGPCKKMDKYVFNKPDVGDFFNAHFIPFKIDAEKGEGPDFVQEYQIVSYPTLLVVAPNGKLIKKGGSMDVTGLLEFGQSALTAEKEFTILRDSYNMGGRDPKTVLAYLALCKERDLSTHAMALEHLHTHSPKHWGTAENLALAKTHLNDPYNEITAHFVKTKEPETEVSKGNHAVYLALYTIYRNYIKEVTKTDNGTTDADELLSNIHTSFYPKQAEELTFELNKELAKRDGDWERYTSVCIAHVNKNLLDNDVSLNNWAMVFYRNKAITDRHALREALGWVDTALKNTKGGTDRKSSFLDTRARVLYKLGRKKKALKAAQRAVRMTKDLGKEPTETMGLINEIQADTS